MFFRKLKAHKVFFTLFTLIILFTIVVVQCATQEQTFTYNVYADITVKSTLHEETFTYNVNADITVKATLHEKQFTYNVNADIVLASKQLNQNYEYNVYADIIVKSTLNQKQFSYSINADINVYIPETYLQVEFLNESIYCNEPLYFNVTLISELENLSLNFSVWSSDFENLYYGGKYFFANFTLSTNQSKIVVVHPMISINTTLSFESSFVSNAYNVIVYDVDYNGYEGLKYAKVELLNNSVVHITCSIADYYIITWNNTIYIFRKAQYPRWGVYQIPQNNSTLIVEIIEYPSGQGESEYKLKISVSSFSYEELGVTSFALYYNNANVVEVQYAEAKSFYSMVYDVSIGLFITLVQLVLAYSNYILVSTTLIVTLTLIISLLKNGIVGLYDWFLFWYGLIKKILDIILKIIDIIIPT